VFGATGQASVSAMEGGSVTLNSSFRQIKQDDCIQWRFGKYLLVDTNVTAGRITVYDDVFDGRFRNRLKLDNQTGSLTITNITMKHTGKYGLKNDNRPMRKSFILTVYKDISVTEGDSVTLNTDLTEISKNDILWECETELIAVIHRATQRFSTSDGGDGRFRNRLKLDNQTGSLTITNITTEHAGDYKLKITGGKRSSKAFRVSVYARLPIPFFSKIFSSSSNCTLLCSVFVVSRVTLSWYEGNSLLSSVSVSDLSFSVSLPLEVGMRIKTATAVCSTIPSATRLNIWTSANSVTHVQ
ncbi:hypothetical protein QQF64_019780, partial [Cirrhinus molitorella]